MFVRLVHRLFPLVIIGAISAVLGVCQDITGTVQGVVTDPAGARVPGVSVELVNEGTRSATTRTTNAEGEFLFNLVAPGRYTISASLTGFKTASTNGIDVPVNKTKRVDMVLQVGAVSESVQVTAEPVRIDSVSAQVSTNVFSKMVIDLPSSTRNALSYAEMAPGVTIQNARHRS